MNEEATDVRAERARIRAILLAPEARGREDLASHLAFETDISPEDAKGVLAAASKQQSGNLFLAAMAAVANPNVGVDAFTDTKVGEIDVTAVYAGRRRRGAT